LSPDAIITHRLSLEEAADGYRIFDKREEDCRKIILTPGFDSRVDVSANDGDMSSA
jgi:hypothetical protein